MLRKETKNCGIHINANQRNSLTIDYALYERYLENSDLSEIEKREFLETLWNVIVGFVDLGFGVHPLQETPSEGCGQKLKIDTLSQSKPIDVVDLHNQRPKKIFSQIAEQPDNCNAERPIESPQS